MDRRESSLLRLSLLLVLSGLVLAGSPPARADDVTDWNVIAIAMS